MLSKEFYSNCPSLHTLVSDTLVAARPLDAGANAAVDAKRVERIASFILY